MDQTTNGNWHNANGGGLPFRPPTVDEALPFSPFSSILLFPPDIIPFPSAEPPNNPTIFQTSTDRETARRSVNALNTDLQNFGPSSSRVQNTIKELKNLLNGDDLTEFQFKPIAKLAIPPPDTPDEATTANGAAPSNDIPLSRFAALLLENTEAPYFHAEVPQVSKPVQSQRMPATPSRPSVPAPLPTPVSNATHYQNDFRMQQQVSTPRSSQNSSQAAVVVKAMPASRREGYVMYEEEAGPQGFSKQRERQDASADQEALNIVSNDRQIADSAVLKLEAVVKDLEAAKDFEDSYKFTTCNTDESEIQVLDPQALEDLEDRVKKVIQRGRFADLPLDLILRIQALCAPWATTVSQLSIALGTDWSEDDIQDWKVRVASARNGLVACRLALRTMTAGREEKEVCSEELVESIIFGLRHVITSCLIPIIEARSTGSNTDIFGLANTHEKLLVGIMQLCGTALNSLGNLIVHVGATDRALTPIEGFCLALIFVENGHNSKESALGIQKFESFRQKAMGVFATIFSCCRDQRPSIMKDVLINLNNLPVSPQSARQFKLQEDGKAIMLVSALVMRLVQASACNVLGSNESIPARAQQPEDSANDDSDQDYRPHNSQPSGTTRVTSQQNLTEIATNLHQGASAIATEFIHYIVERALTSTKSGDNPFRNLLDLFAEDFCNALGSPEWPAAELLLGQLCAKLQGFIVDQQKKDFTVVVKNMALDVLALVGSGIIDFKSRAQSSVRKLDPTQSELSNRLVQLADHALSPEALGKQGVNNKDLLNFEGLYRMMIECLPHYLGVSWNSGDPRLLSVAGCHITFWANTFCAAYLSFKDNDPSLPEPPPKLEKYLKQMALDPQWLSRKYEFENVSEDQGRVVAQLIALQSQICQYLPAILRTLTIYTRNQSSSLKTRAMQGLTQLLDKDPSVLDDSTFRLIKAMTNDPSSPMVREKALLLMAKCLAWNPDWEESCLGLILNRVVDSSLSVKKRALKLAKDVYLRNNDDKIRAVICTRLLETLKDDDQGVVEITRQTYEEVWLIPFYEGSKNDKVAFQLSLRKQIALFVQIVQSSNSEQRETLETLFKYCLSKKAKNQAPNFKTLKALVDEMFNGVISPELIPGNPSQSRLLETIGIFAKVSPKLFTSAQVQSLKPYIENINTNMDDFRVFHSCARVFRYVLPSLSSLSGDFLESIRNSLHNGLSKILAVPEFVYDVVQSLWIVSQLVKDGIRKLFLTVRTANTHLKQFERFGGKLEGSDLTKFQRYARLLGNCGQVFNFENENAQTFQTIMTSTIKGGPQQITKGSGSVLLIETLLPFIGQKWDLNVRQPTLDALCQICQNYPQQFMRPDVGVIFKTMVLEGDSVDLKFTVLNRIKEFYASVEKPEDEEADNEDSKNNANGTTVTGGKHGAERMEKSYVASKNDQAVNYLAQVYLRHIVRIALGPETRLAVLATDIIVRISRQDILHSAKECGPVLIALETSPNASIAKKAHEEHQSLHIKWESNLDKEYMKAVKTTFEYQRDVIKDSHGAVLRADRSEADGSSERRNRDYRSKMHSFFEVLKSGNRKSVKKFLTTICDRLDIDLGKLNTKGDCPESLLFARFCLENLGFFEYTRNDELYHLILTLERIVKRSGIAVAHAIETEVLGYRLDTALQQLPSDLPAPPEDGRLEQGSSSDPAPSQPITDQIDQTRLHHLTVASMILHIMWQTRCYIREKWNVGKINPKELNKAPTRLSFNTGEKLWDPIEDIMAGLKDAEAMKAQCKKFVDLLNRDNEHKFTEEEAEGNEDLAKLAAGYETPDEDELVNTAAQASGGGRGRKRKSMAGATGGTPKKQKVAGKGRSRPSGSKKQKRDSRTPDDDSGWD